MPAQDDTFLLDPAREAAALRLQRNEAMDEAARWRAVAMAEREANRELAAKIAETPDDE